MSQSRTSNDAARARVPAVGFARLARLTLKELRETLRDRRTTITLVLMPLLVYPVLSLAFRQFLLSSFQQSGEMRWRFAVSSEAEFLPFRKLLHDGEQLLERREQSAAASAPTGSGPILGADVGANEPPMDNIEFVALEDLEGAIRNRDIDLGVRLLQREPDIERGLGETEYTFQLVFRPGSPTSRQAANFVERRLRAVNEHFVRARLKRLGDESKLPAGWRLKPLADEKSFWLGTLVPLVLILMTITGAVYPAIDLTAGERERGTLEALMAAPVSRLSLLMAKYVAVLTVAMLTAVVNLTAMTVTVASSGLAPILFGSGGLSPGSIIAVLALLVLFAAFFSAVLLSITSFARSFKEAQAYLIPLMLVSLAPGFMSVMPDLELGPLLSVTPLANIVLLARDVLEGDAPLLWGAAAVLTTLLYGGFALALAARIFGSDAILYGSQSSWSDLFRRPQELRTQATIPGALAALALVAPLFIIASGMLGLIGGRDISSELAASSAVTLLLFICLPLAMARWQGVELWSGFQVRKAPLLAFVGAVILGCSLAPLVMEMILVSRKLGLTMISEDQLQMYAEYVEALIRRWRTIPFAAVIVSLAVVPAVAEELFFRGYLLGALRGRLPGWSAIGLTGFAFGLFHASLGGVILLDRVVPSTVLGLVLGWVCWHSRSVVPGIVLHLINNGLMLSLAYWEEEVKGLGLDALGRTDLPWSWLVGASLLTVIGLALVYFGRGTESKSAENLESRLGEVSHVGETTPGLPR